MSSTDRAKHWRTAAGLALLGLVSACAAPHTPDPTQVAQPKLPTEQFRPVVETRPVDLALAVHPQGALSERQKSALTDFAQRWRDAGGDSVTVRSPDDGDGRLMGANAVAALTDAGVPIGSIRQSAAPANPSGAVIALSFEAAVARGPDCAGHWDNMAATGQNRAYAHFGCADAANLAAMVADPHDLTRPKTETPYDATRRETVLGKYRKGELTSSQKDDQATGAISQAVK
jgi:pilus assembly protein CpaD